MSGLRPNSQGQARLAHVGALCVRAAWLRQFGDRCRIGLAARNIHPLTAVVYRPRGALARTPVDGSAWGISSSIRTDARRRDQRAKASFLFAPKRQEPDDLIRVLRGKLSSNNATHPGRRHHNWRLASGPSLPARNSRVKRSKISSRSDARVSSSIDVPVNVGELSHLQIHII